MSDKHARCISSPFVPQTTPSPLHIPSFAKHYRYIVKVVTTTETYNVFRRYSRFHDLSKRMSLRVPLPAKGSYFMRSTSTNTERVKKRMEGLDQWIAEVFQTLKTQRREIDRLSFDESKQLIANIEQQAC